VTPLQKALWVFVVLAALGAAAAGVAALSPLPVLGELGPDGRLPGLQIIHFDPLGCDRECWAAAHRLKAAFPKGTWGSRVQQHDAPRVGMPQAYAHLPDLGSTPKPGVSLPVYWSLGDWSLTDTDGKPFGSAELAGNVWIADFMFTNCAGPCPMMNEAMKNLIGRLPDHPRLKFVSFSVDPKNDTPEVLREFAKKVEAPDRWKFLTGEAVFPLGRIKFKLGELEENPGAPAGMAVTHSTRFTLIDGEGRMRGTYRYDYDEPELIPPMMDRLVNDAQSLLAGTVEGKGHDRRRFLVDAEGKVRGIYGTERVESLVRDVRRLAGEPEPPLSVKTLPKVNAILNGTSFLFLALGLAFILNRRIFLHKASMTLALIASLAFLACYVTYHLEVGSVKYAGGGWMRSAYFGILLTHTVLAAVVAPMAVVTVVRAWTARLDRHVALARWTLPIWMYVSLTGILVYLMLYRLS
jgi:protein SCO1/2